jgi:hypothetical protein
MAAILTLDDGRHFMAPNLGIVGVYALLSRHLPHNRALARWLFDKSHQCAPFFDIDTREFNEADRLDFWGAVQKAVEALESYDGPERGSVYYVRALATAKSAIDRGDPVPPGEWRDVFDDEKIDPLDTWQTAAELDVLMAKEEAEFPIP